jgi:hypothetical protein
VALIGAPREAGDGSPGILVPVGRPETGERGDEVDAAVVVYLAGKVLDLRGVADNLEFIPEPLHHGSGYED